MNCILASTFIPGVRVLVGIDFRICFPVEELTAKGRPGAGGVMSDRHGVGVSRKSMRCIC